MPEQKRRKKLGFNLSALEGAAAIIDFNFNAAVLARPSMSHLTQQAGTRRSLLLQAGPPKWPFAANACTTLAERAAARSQLSR